MGATVAELAAAVSVEGVTEAEAGLSSFGASVDAAGQKQGTAAQQSAAHDASLRKVGNTALAMGGLMVAGFGLAIGSTLSFDKAMSGVGAVADATQGQLGQLRQAAIEAGQATAYSATEAATAEAELAKAGVSVSDILGGGLTGALSLAAAGQLDLKDAATITAQALNVFNLTGDQASHVADVLAAGANKSAADVGQLGDALRQGGLMARQTGMSLEDTVGVLALFADNALIGSDAGTSLKTMLQRLTPQSQEAADTMQSLGIHAYDAQGNFVGLDKFAGNLRSSLSGLTVEQRNTALATIFGSDAVRAASLLYDAGEAGVRKYTKAVDDQGAAGRMAGAQMDNLSGDIEQLRGSIETGLIQSGSGATSVLRFMAQGATDVVNGFSQMDPAIQTGVAAVVGFSGAGLLAIGTGLKFKQMLDELGKSADFSPGLSKTVSGLGKVAAGAAIAGVSLSLVQSGSESSSVGVLGLAASGALMGSTFGPVGAVIGGTTGAIVGMTDAVIGSADNVDNYRAKIAGLASELDSLGTKQAGQKFVDNLGMEDLIKFAAGGMTAVRGIKDELEALGTKSPAAVAKVVDSLKAMHDEDGKPLFTGKALEALDGIVGRVNAKYKEHAGNARDAASANQQLAGAEGEAAGKTSAFADALQTADTHAKNFKSTIDALLGVGLDVESANLAWRDSLDAITKSLQENGATLDINTEQGRNNREAMVGSTEKAIAFAEAQFKATGNIADANNVISLQIGQLANAATQAGLSGDAVLTYIEDILGIPPEARTDIHNTADIARYMAIQLEQKYNDLDGRTVTTTAQLNDLASGPLSYLVSTLNGLDGRTVSALVNTIYSTTGAPDAAYTVAQGAHGLVGLARGGAGMLVGPNRPVVIGEGISREAVVPYDNFGDAVATIKNSGQADTFLRASMAAGGKLGSGTTYGTGFDVGLAGALLGGWANGATSTQQLLGQLDEQLKHANLMAEASGIFGGDATQWVNEANELKVRMQQLQDTITKPPDVSALPVPTAPSTGPSGSKAKVDAEIDWKPLLDALGRVDQDLIDKLTEVVAAQNNGAYAIARAVQDASGGPAFANGRV